MVRDTRSVRNTLRRLVSGRIATAVKLENLGEPISDAFGRLRVSGPVTIFDSQLEYDGQPLIWNTEAQGTGSETHLPNESSMRMDVEVTDGDSFVRQTREYFRYQPGKSQLIFMTFSFANIAIANNRKRIGYFDDFNGIFLEQDGPDTFIVKRTNTSGSPVDLRVAQEDWGLDTFDGNGDSRIALAMNNTIQLLVIDLDWLSAGRVRVGFIVGGKIIYAHEFTGSNDLSVPYMSTANLPLRYEISNQDTLLSATSMKAICTSVISEGGQEVDRGLPGAVNTGITDNVSVGLAGEIPILSIRANTVFNGSNNHAAFRNFHSIVTAKSQDVYVRVRRNAALGNAAFNAVSGTGEFSSMEFDIAANTFIGGDIIEEYVVLSGQGNQSGSAVIFGQDLGRLPFGTDIDGTNADILTITAVAQADSSLVTGGFNWRELR